MDYTTLEKLYYMDNAKYNQTYLSRFNSENAIKLNFFIGNNQAFFIQTPHLTSLFFNILRVDKRISFITNKLPNVAISQFANRCLVDEILVTNKIEGVHSTRKEISDVLSSLEQEVQQKENRKRFKGLIAKYAKLRSEDNIPLFKSKDIRTLYDEIVLPEVIAENPSNVPDGQIFRRDAASIKTVTDKEIHRGIYPETKIIESVDNALSFLNNTDIESLYRICIFHYLLEYIHPFYDGNGRLGRFIVSYLLSKELTPLISYRISTTIIENINKYYNAFKTCNNPNNLGDLTPFLLMMADILNTSVLQLESALNERFLQLAHCEKMISNLPFGNNARTADLYSYLIQAGLFSEKGISYTGLQTLLQCSYGTVKQELDKVKQSNCLILHCVGQKHFFMLDIQKLYEMYTGNNKNN